MNALALHTVQRGQLLSCGCRRSLHKVIKPLFNSRDEHRGDTSHVEKQIGIPGSRSSCAIDAKRLSQALLSLGRFASVGARKNSLRLSCARYLASVYATFTRHLTHLRALSVRAWLTGMAHRKASVFARVQRRFARLST